jgi:hypothetical protein
MANDQGEVFHHALLDRYCEVTLMLAFRVRKDFPIRKAEDGTDRFVSNGEGIEFADDQCHRCKRWHRGTLTCEAFPDGIPLGFLTGDYDHTSPYPGDGGKLFLPIDDTD